MHFAVSCPFIPSIIWLKFHSKVAISYRIQHDCRPSPSVFTNHNQSMRSTKQTPAVSLVIVHLCSKYSPASQITSSNALALDWVDRDRQCYEI